MNTILNPDGGCNSSPTIKSTATTVHSTVPSSTSTRSIELPDDDGDNSQSIALTSGIVASLVVVAVVFNIIVTFLIVYCIRKRRSKGQSPSVGKEQSDEIVDEERYSTHSDMKELNAMTREAYTIADIRTKRNEAYGAPVTTSGGTSVVRYFV